MKVFILLAAYCLAVSAHAITNSVPAEEIDFGAVVFLQNKGFDDRGEILDGYCVGTFVSNSTIVTAAHCLAYAAVLQQRETKIQFGAYKYIINPKGERVRVGYRVTHELKVNPQFKFPQSVADKIQRQGRNLKIQPGEDVALIILEQPVDLQAMGLVPASVVSSSEITSMKNNLSAYNPTIVSVNPIAESAITSIDTRRKAQLRNLKISGTSLESRSGSRVEPGDSGCPLFVRIGTQWKLLAVTKGKAKSFFDDWDMFTLVFL